jgi:DNA helicase-2/ATP-dependent DNA helicase PcrA
VKTKIILGPPGTGKTHTLLNRVEEELARGTPPDRIAFLAFTKKAATEARDRAMKKFDLEEQHLPYFRTLHSFAFHQLGLTKAEVMSRDNYKEFAQSFGMDLGSVTDGNDSGGVFTTDNMLINEVNLSRMKCMELEHHYNHSNLQDVSWHALLRAQRSLEEFKKKKEIFDFTDMIELYLDSGPVPKLDVVFIDEAQDLCKLQWRMLHKITQDPVKKIYVSGDDDQAIYRWAGADVDHLIRLNGEREVLQQSYRCSKVIQNCSQRIIGRVRNRIPKKWQGTDKSGFVQYHNYPEGVNLREPGSWLVLARTNYMLDEIERDIRLQGMLYKRNNKLPVSTKLLNAVESWKKLNREEIVPLVDIKNIYSYMSSQIGIERGHKNLRMADKEEYELEELVMHHGLLMAGRPWDVAFDKVGNRDKEYLRAIEMRGKVSTNPQLHLSTIHGAKGGEADNVMLLTDLSRKSQEAMEKDSDDECRVFYVGATRARNQLHIVQPQREGGFII